MLPLQFHVAKCTEESPADVAHLPGTALRMVKATGVFLRNHGFDRIGGSRWPMIGGKDVQFDRPAAGRA